jgi:uncharacterized membrane protein HdeD (DUF308 family)
MKKYTPIYLYGAVTVLEGIFLLFSRDSSFHLIKMTTGVTLTIGALIAFYAAFTRQRNHVQFAYHEMHALAMLVYGISVLAFCNSFEKLVSFTAFLFIFYFFSEITFCIWLYNLKRRIVLKIVIIRLILGLAIGFGTIIAMNFPKFDLECFGLLFMMVGINILLYAPVMKGNDVVILPAAPQTLIP